MKFAIPTAVAVAALMLGATAANATTIYSNDFEGGLTTGFSNGLIYNSPNGVNFLGRFTNGGGGDGSSGGGTTTLTLNTAGYSSLTLNLDIYAVLSVDGDNANNGPGGNSPQDPDSFIITGDGGQQIFTIKNSFANYPGATQSFGPAAENAPETGATSVNTLGYCFNGPNGCIDDAMYSLSFTFNPTGAQTVLTFQGHANQDVNDEFFGIDNVVVTGTAPGVPEPATWALSILGFGLAGGALRRRRTGLLTA